MATTGAITMERKPTFTTDQIVTTTDVVKQWRKTVERKLNEVPFVLIMNGKNPKAAIMSYDNFLSLWRTAQEAEDILLRLEVLCRMAEQEKSGERLYTLKEVVEELGITPEDLEDIDDVDISVD